MLWCAAAHAQPPPAAAPLVSVRHLPGLSDRALLTAMQDQAGRVWFGSPDGLLVTNGVEVAHYRFDPADSSSISGRFVRHIVADGDSVLWLATENGPCAFLPATHRARRTAAPMGTTWPRCEQLWLDEGRRLWMATAEGPMRFDPRSSELAHWPLAGGCAAVHPHPADGQRVLVVGTDAVHTLDPATGLFTAMPHPIGEFPYASGPSTVKDGALWISHWGRGVVRYDLRTGAGALITYARPDGLPGSYTAHFSDAGAGRLWVSTLDAGMVLLDTRSGRFTERHPLEGGARDLMGAYVRDPLQLRDGSLVLCTDRGLYQLTRPRHQSTFIEFPDDGRVDESPVWVSAMVEDGATGDLYIGTSDGQGLLRLDHQGRWQGITVPDEHPGRAARIDRLLPTRDRWLWIAARHGLFRMRMPDGELERVHAADGMRVRSLLEDDQGGIWAGTAEDGLLQFDDAGLLLAHHHHRPDDPASLIADLGLRSLATDTLGRIWVGTRHGLSVLDPVTGRCRNFGHDPRELQGFSAPYIRGIVRDGHGAMWISRSLSGIRRVEVDAEGRFAMHTLPGGSVPLHEGTQDLVIDRHDRIWAVDHGIDMLDTRTGHFRHYTMNDGIATFQGLDASLVVTGDGRLVLGVEGEPLLQVFRTDDLLTTGEAPPIEWTLLAGREGPLHMEQASNADPQATIAFNDLPLRVRFAAIAMSHPLDLRYHYRLLGLDSTWSALGIERSLHFATLAPGDYTLEVRTSLEGQWMDNVQRIRITVRAPWYRTPAVMVAGALLILVLVVLLVRWRITVVQRRATFQRRLAEVEMQALRAQMNPHFLFNSLNSIKYYALTKDPRSTADYLGKFALLVRKVLQNSRAPMVPLREELDALRLYVEIEAMRLEDKFGWRFEVDPRLDLDALRVPPMLLQPYVENAIWHGLMNREGHGELRMAMSLDDGHVRCVIEDDGVGRARAEEIKREQGPRERSFGMRITAERMELAAKAMGLDVTARVEDLRHADGGPSGTRVTVSIPVTLDHQEP